jgi:hypothetical protein
MISNVYLDVLKDIMPIKNQELANLVTINVLYVGDLMKIHVKLVILHSLFINLTVLNNALKV